MSTRTIEITALYAQAWTRAVLMQLGAAGANLASYAAAYDEQFVPQGNVSYWNFVDVTVTIKEGVLSIMIDAQIDMLDETNELIYVSLNATFSDVGTTVVTPLSF